MCGPAVRIRGSVETARAYSAKRTQQLSDAGVAEVVGNGEGREAVLSLLVNVDARFDQNTSGLDVATNMSYRASQEMLRDLTVRRQPFQSCKGLALLTEPKEAPKIAQAS